MDNSQRPPAQPPAPKSPALRALMRLFVGGTLTGAEELLRQMRAWEDELEALRSAPPPPSGQPASPAGQENPFVFSQPPAEETPAVLLRYALIGWLMEGEKRLSRRISQAEQIRRGVWNLASPLVKPWLAPFKHSRLFAPLRREYDDFLRRGQTELERWIEIGRQEELRSRDLTRMAAKRTVDDSIEYLATNPKVEQLVETQSTGLANEVVEEVRERTISADTFVESLVRTLLKRTPRPRLPEPPETVRQSADGFRADAGKKTHHNR